MMAERILFHFDIEKNYLPVNDFVIMANSLQKVSSAIVGQCYKNAKYEISVCPAEMAHSKDGLVVF